MWWWDIYKNKSMSSTPGLKLCFSTMASDRCSGKLMQRALFPQHLFPSAAVSLAETLGKPHISALNTPAPALSQQNWTGEMRLFSQLFTLGAFSFGYFCVSHDPSYNPYGWRGQKKDSFPSQQPLHKEEIQGFFSLFYLQIHKYTYSLVACNVNNTIHFHRYVFAFPCIFVRWQLLLKS